MPPRKSLTRRFIHHLLLLSLARTILTVLGRGRAWDEWDERNYESQPAQQRGYRLRLAHTVSFCMLFFAGLALSAGAGNGVQSLLEADRSAPASADGTTGPTGPTGAAGRTAFQSAARGIEAQQRVAPAKPVAPATRVVAKTAVLSSRPTHAATLSAAAPSSATKKTAISKTHVARPAVVRSKPGSKPKRKAPKAHPVKAPALDPEVNDYRAATIWLNRAAPDPTPPAARLRLRFARELVTYAHQAHVDWALVLATLRAEGHNGRVPAGSVALRALAFRLSGLGGRANPWAAALAVSSDTAVADRVVALRHYYRAVGLASLVHGLLSQKADLQDRVLNNSRLALYSGGRSDVAKGRVDVRVLAVMLYLAQSYNSVSVSCLVSGHRLFARPGVVSAHIYGRAVDIAGLGGTSVAGHQQPGGMTEHAVRSILMLPGGMLPKQVISLLGMGGPSFALANHADHIHVGY